MSRALRALFFFLAVLPTIWGNCPGIVNGRCCCAPAALSSNAGAAKAPCCERCREREERSNPQAPCSGCRCAVARDGSTPVPAAVETPVADSTWTAVPTVADASPVVDSARVTFDDDIRAPGGPPDLVGVVVLLI